MREARGGGRGEGGISTAHMPTLMHSPHVHARPPLHSLASVRTRTGVSPLASRSCGAESCQAQLGAENCEAAESACNDDQKVSCAHVPGMG